MCRRGSCPVRRQASYASPTKGNDRKRVILCDTKGLVCQLHSLAQRLSRYNVQLGECQEYPSSADMDSLPVKDKTGASQGLALIKKSHVSGRPSVTPSELSSKSMSPACPVSGERKAAEQRRFPPQLRSTQVVYSRLLSAPWSGLTTQSILPCPPGRGFARTDVSVSLWPW